LEGGLSLSRRGKKGSALGDASKDATLTPVPEITGGGGGSSMNIKEESITLVTREYPTFVESPFGQRYLVDRSRPIPADQYQLTMSKMLFRLRGWHEYGENTVYLEDYDAGSIVLANWYPYVRAMAKAALKYKHLPLNLNDTSTFEDYLNVYYYACHNLTALANLQVLVSYNEAFASLYQYLPSKFSRIRRLWARLAAIWAPNFLKTHAIKNGMICKWPGHFEPHFRLADENPLVMYGGGADYTALRAYQPYEILQSNTYLTNLIDNIEKAIWALEGYITYDADVLEDVTSIVDLVHMSQDILPGRWVQGLPAFSSFPGLIDDPAYFTELYARCLVGVDSHGVYDDQLYIFPVAAEAQFRSLIPVKGWGQIDPFRAYSYMGAAKVALLANDKTEYSDTVLVWQYYGTDMPIRIDSNNAPGNDGCQYSREDGWMDREEPDDLGDASELALAVGEGTIMNARHIWMSQALIGQITYPGWEFSMVDSHPVDFTFWMDPNDLGGNFGQFLAVQLGIPYVLNT
jgi:hypothetical protein